MRFRAWLFVLNGKRFETQKTRKRKDRSCSFLASGFQISSSPMTTESPEAQNGDYAMPNSRRVYVSGELHPEIRVPFREISLARTKTTSGEIEVNEPVRVYD